MNKAGFVQQHQNLKDHPEIYKWRITNRAGSIEKKTDTWTISCRRGRLQVITGHPPCKDNTWSPESPQPLIYHVLSCVRSMRKINQPQSPSKYGDMINKSYENCHTIMLPFPFREPVKILPCKVPYVHLKHNTNKTLILWEIAKRG